MKTNTNQNQIKAQSRPEQLSTSTGNRPKINMELRRANRALDTEKLLALLRVEAPQLFEIAEIIGKWVWIRFEQKQPDTVTALLSQLGFHWNNKRQSWQHPCGNFRLQSPPVDPRKKFGSHFAADHKAA